jgi:arsenate reductase (thioredoxin)
MIKMKKVLFVCVGNSGRSQMAEAFLNALAGGKIIAISAGTIPAAGVDPVVVEVMQEEGIDISTARPKQLTAEMLQDADKVITMGCGVEEACPAVRVYSEDWGLPDPKGKSREEIRKVRDGIKDRVIKLLQ